MNAKTFLSITILFPLSPPASAQLEAQLRSEVQKLSRVAAAEARSLESALDEGWLLLTLRDLQAVHTRVGIGR